MALHGMVAADFELSSAEYEILWSDLGLGRMPYPVDVPSVGRYASHRERVRVQVYDALRDRGMFPRGRLDVGLDSILRVLARHQVSIDIVGYIDTSVRALAASDGHSAVLATLNNERVALSEIRTTALARSAATLLPPSAPGPGKALSLRWDALDRAAEWELAELAGDHLRGGQFGLSTRAPQSTVMRRGATLLSWFDTDKGRYLAVREGEWVSFAPANNDRIIARLEHMLAATDH
ncbi:ESX secretion-associated protein EspG [Actinocrispum wychmicini]|uniref:ESAT-6 protein secretion system EspG family protein n=1 Tax=Actinocrispum wychmicini TaxID=1213861 RepID=A0A4R2JC70_9PSEU|nr:ESX secretion-associated protein EspG [Actinocrispum wychmicini]TCO56017.1 ESAT-6 protein secretion system EspG family protein [Actinocrispum wychmicini]